MGSRRHRFFGPAHEVRRPRVARLWSVLRRPAWRWPVGLLLAGLLLSPLPAPAMAQGGAAVTQLELRRSGDTLQVHFVTDGPASATLVGNLRRQVLVVKFRDVRAAFPNDQRIFAFNDPFVEGIAFEEVEAGQTWAKLRLRTGQLQYDLAPAPGENRVVLNLRPAPPVRGPMLTDVALDQHQGDSRILLSFTQPVAYETADQNGQYLVRLRGIGNALETTPQREDSRVRLESIESDGDDLLVRLQLKRQDQRVIAQSLSDPPRLALQVRIAAPAAPPPPATAEAPPPSPVIVPRGESLEQLLADEPNPVLRANYILGEREYRAGRYAASNDIFLRVYQAATDRPLGIRGYFQASDAQYALLREQGATRYHGVIRNYQAAIRAAEAADYESDLIPRAFFQVARSYQHMDFFNEANVNYQILQERFADDPVYAPDSYYFRGETFLGLRDYDRAVASFRAFLQKNGDPGLEAPAYYNLGDTYYNQKRYPEAKRAFDNARRIDAEYANAHPLLLFHMGEAYYENAEFDVARVIYRTLLDRYPNRSFTKLVSLRLGDFLREEGKDADALAIYRQVLQGAPMPIALRARMRIAGLLAKRPDSLDYPEAIALYNDVIRDGGTDPIVEEARLRKALTLTLHNQHEAAITAFEELVQHHPDSPFARDNIVQANIQENLKSLIDRFFADGKYWDIARIYTRYQERYFTNFRFPFTMFQVSDAYQHLGLFDDTIRIYDRLLAGQPGPMQSLIAYRRARTFLDKDDLGRAEEELLRYIQGREEDPYLSDARMDLGQAYFAARRYTDALNAYKIMVQDFEQNQGEPLGEAIAEVHHRLGLIYRELGQMKNAADAFRASIENFHHPIQGDLVPDYIILSHFMIGDSLYDLAQNDEAIKAYEEAIGLYPEHDKAPWARYQIGLIYRRSGEERKALDTFNALMELAKVRPGELWEPLARENQRDLVNALEFKNYVSE